MSEKDYSLLRPFDAEAAKRGEPICCPIGKYELLPRKFISGPDARGWICIEYPGGSYDVCIASQYRMAPLAWVEGKPVYKGDVLYVKNPTGRTGDVVTAEFPDNGDGSATFRASNGAVPTIRFDDLTWTPPKVKREGWIAIKTADRPVGYKYTHWCSHVCATEEVARDYYRPSVDVVVVPVLFEEPAA